MTPVTLTIGGLGSDMLTTRARPVPAARHRDVVGLDAGARRAASSLLTASDFEFLFAEAYTPTTARYAETQFTGTETTLDLPAALTGIVFGPGKASCGHAARVLTSCRSTCSRRARSGSSRRSRGRRAGSTPPTRPRWRSTRSPPGFDASWSIDPGASYGKMFQAMLTRGQRELRLDGVRQLGGSAVREAAVVLDGREAARVHPVAAHDATQVIDLVLQDSRVPAGGLDHA